LWYNTEEGQFYFTHSTEPAGSSESSSPPPRIPANAFMHSATPFQPRLYPQSGELQLSGRPMSGQREPRTVHLTGLASGHHYHGLIDDWVSLYAEVTEEVQTPSYINSEATTVFHFGALDAKGGATAIDERMGQSTAWHHLVMPVFTAQPAFPTRPLLAQWGRWVWVRLVAAMGIR
jgi:hypothetical protein